MADTKISGLPAVVTPADTDEIPVNQGGATKKETRAQITAAALKSANDLSDVASAATARSNLSVDGALAPLDSVGTTEIDASAVTNAKLADMAQNTIKGRITASTGAPEDLTAANVRTIINVEDGAQVNTVTLAGAETLTNKTIDGDNNTLSLTTDSVDAITEIAAALKSGVDTTLVTGTAGTNGNLVQWNADGDAVDASIAATDVVTPSSTDTLTNKTIDGDSNTLSNLAIGAEVTGTAVGSLDMNDNALFGHLASKNAQTGTAYTLALSDSGKTITMDNASANTVTIPTNAAVAFPVNTQIDIWMKGAGTTTVQGDTGVTVNGVSAGGAAIQNQYHAVTIFKDHEDTWFMTGDHGTVA